MALSLALAGLLLAHADLQRGAGQAAVCAIPIPIDHCACKRKSTAIAINLSFDDIVFRVCVCVENTKS